MRSITTFTAIAIMTAASGRVVATQAAQENAPAGPYQQTCSDISVKKGNLYAKCQDEKGKAHSTKLSHYEKCGSEIVNNNGSLGCSHAKGSPTRTGVARDGANGAPAKPSGPFTETCKNIQMKGTTLHAVCKSIDGREMPTSLREANRCSQGIVNMNGILNCAVSDVLPPGSYMATCKDIRLQGTTLHASCNNGKDRWLPAELRDAHKCSGDISNYQGSLRCSPIKHMAKR